MCDIMGLRMIHLGMANIVGKKKRLTPLFSLVTSDRQSWREWDTGN